MAGTWIEECGTFHDIVVSTSVIVFILACARLLTLTSLKL